MIISGGDNLAKTLTAGTQNDLNSQLSSGKLVAISPQAQSSIGKPLTYGVGIRNSFDQKTTFGVDVYYSKDNSDGAAEDWNLQYMKNISIDANQHGNAVLVVRESGSSISPGQYIFIVNTTYYDDSGQHQYDSPRFFTVTVGR